jgi:hypothetical protein
MKASTQPSSIDIRTGGAASYSGPDAVHLVRAVYLKSAMGLYLKTGIRPTRGVGPTQMLAIASEYTGKKYKRTELATAQADVQTWIDTMKAAIPTTVDGVQQ